jgi:DNA-binding MarR family transcriptional regulator
MMVVADSRHTGDRLPLAALVSQALVAFTIEFDNEFEHQMPHRTTNHGSTPGSDCVRWLVSMAMWVHCMRYVPEDGIPAGELARRAQLTAKGAEMVIQRMSKWWGYLTVNPDPADTRANPPGAAWVVRPTCAGRRAQRVWEPLTGVIEDRWRDRFGGEAIDDLRGALVAVVSRLDLQLPAYLPIGAQPRSWRLVPSDGSVGPKRDGGAVFDLPLWALLSKVLLTFAIDYERESAVSLALGANVVRVLDDVGVRVRDLRALTGLAEMGVENSLSTLNRQGYVTVGPAPSGGRAKLARLTAKGVDAHTSHGRRVGEVEHKWEARFGKPAVDALRKPLRNLVGDGTARDSPLFQGLEPYPDGWRSKVPRPETLPRYPVVSHRGGFPDGS